MALDPDILFFDEPSAGLDPISSRLLDELILELRDSLGATVVMVTHELASIFTIGTNSVFLDADTKTMIAQGDPEKAAGGVARPEGPPISHTWRPARMKRANPAVIGGFIVGAVVLAIAGVMMLGSGKLFTETIKCVMYFEGAIQGLYVGAPVNFRGVKVGSVTSIKMQFDRQNFDIRIPVIVDFPKGAGGTMEMLNADPRTPTDALAALIERGLRAQLQTDSLVTGLLFIAT